MHASEYDQQQRIRMYPHLLRFENVDTLQSVCLRARRLEMAWSRDLPW